MTIRTLVWNDQPSVHKVQASTGLDVVAYNTTTKALYVRPADSENVYVYHNVDADTWDRFKHTDSLGRFYNRVIKKRFKSSEKISCGDVMWSRDSGYNTAASNRSDAGRRANDSLSANRGTVGTPKGLVDKTSDKLFESKARDEQGPLFSLKRDGSGSVSGLAWSKPKAQVKVTFVVDNGVAGNSPLVWNVEADGSEQAIDMLNKHASALGLKFKVKEVVVRFE